jgi:hypothetical protein
MLKPMWKNPACTKPDVIGRHQSPAATSGPASAQSCPMRPTPSRRSFDDGMSAT